MLTAREPLAGLVEPTNAVARLVTANRDTWIHYTDHKFVQRMADGSLPYECFKHYLIQDYLFLVQFARAYALVVFKADGPDALRIATGKLRYLINDSVRLHIAFCREWGLDEASMASQPEAGANMAYTRFVLERGMQGDVLDMLVAMSPCSVGYGDIANRVRAFPGYRLSGNPYRKWLETYAGNENQDLARNAALVLDDIYTRRGGDDRFDDLSRTFAAATRLESGFWQMGLDLSM